MVSVLLIDDDELCAKLVEAYLTARFGPDFTLVYVRGLNEGLRALIGQRFDHIFLGNRLPPFSDYRETLPIVRLYAKGTEPIVLTASMVDDCFTEQHVYGANVWDKLQVPKRILAGMLG